MREPARIGLLSDEMIVLRTGSLCCNLGWDLILIQIIPSASTHNGMRMCPGCEAMMPSTFPAFRQSELSLHRPDRYSSRLMFERATGSL